MEYDPKDDYEAMFDATFLRWFDLNGQPALIEIVGLEKKEVTMRGGARKTVPVVHWKQVQGKIEKVKSLVANRTNMDELAKIFGTRKLSEWKGKRAVLFQTTTQLKGETVPC